MNKFLSSLIAALTLLGVSAPARSISVLPPPPVDVLPPSTSAGKPTQVPGQVIVKMKPGSGINALLNDSGLTLLETIPELGVEVVSAPVGAERSTAQLLGGRSDVEYAETNGLYYALAVPNDTYYRQSYQWYLPLINAPAAWDISTGSDTVIVANLDTGVDNAHPDLKAKLLSGYNAITRVAGTTSYKDDQGHGTFTSGISAAVSNNNAGIAGVSWGAKILPVKVLNSSGAGSDTNIAAGIRWAADNGAKVINMSLGGTGASQTAINAVNYASDKGCLILAAMGNEFMEGNPTEYPAAYPKVMAVGATTETDERSSYSNTGPHISVTAPGGDVLEENDQNIRHYIFSSFWNKTNRTSGYVGAVGTSAATPVVAGLAALLWSVSPNATAAQIRSAIEESAVDLGAAGKDDDFGYGRIDALAAVQKIQESIGESDLTPPTATITAPAANATVSGAVTIKGSVSDDKALKSYQVQFGAGTGPTSWTNIGAAGTTPVSAGGTLANWNTSSLTDGKYTLRVTAQDVAGNNANSNPITVTVSNVVTTLNIRANPTVVKAGGRVTVTVSASQSLQAPPTVNATGGCINPTLVTMTQLGANYTGTFTAPAGGSDCVVTLTAAATDATGKAARTDSTTIQLDRTAPVAQAQTQTTGEDQPLTLTLSATDLSGVTYAVVSGPSHGTLGAVNGNQIVYTPAADYSGPDSFTFKANDGALDGNPATVTLTVTPVNDPPVASNVSAQTSFGVGVAVTLSATDPDGDALTYVVVAPPQNGALSGTAPNLTYTPNAGFTGSDSFSYKAQDAGAESAVAVATVNVVASLVVVGSGQVAPGAASTLSVSLTAAAMGVTGIDLFLRARGPEGAPALIPSFAVGAQNADWTVTPDAADPYHFMASGAMVNGPAEVLKLTLQTPANVPPGTVYTLETLSAAFAQGAVNFDASAFVLPGSLTVGGCTAALRGDINGDGALNVSDVVFILRTAVGLENPDSCARSTGDLDRNNAVDLVDAVTLLRHLILTEPLP